MVFGMRRSVDQAREDLNARADAFQDQISEVSLLLAATLITVAALAVFAVIVAVGNE